MFNNADAPDLYTIVIMHFKPLRVAPHSAAVTCFINLPSLVSFFEIKSYFCWYFLINGTIITIRSAHGSYRLYFAIHPIKLNNVCRSTNHDP